MNRELTNYGIITKLGLKQYFALPEGKKERKKKIGIMVGLSIAFLPLILLICVGIYFISGYALKNNQGQSVLSAIMTMAQIITLFFGAASFMSVMYYSKDNEFLNTLPIKPLTIFLSKFTIVYLTSTMIAFAITIPTFITVAISGAVSGVSLNAGYYIFGIIGAIFTPMIPLAVVAILSMPIAYLGKFFKKNQALSVIIYLALFVGFFIGYMVFVLKMQNMGAVAGGEGDMDAMLNGMLSTFGIMGKIVYPNFWLASAMVGTKIAVNASLYIFIIIAISAIAIVLAAFMYKRNSMRFLEITYNTHAKNKVIKAKGQLKALIIRDLKTCFRDTSLAINMLLGLILAPVMVGLFSILSPMGDGSQAYASGMVFAMGVMMLVGTNYLANIAISREGEKFYIIKYLPIAPKDYINAKRILSLAYLVIGAVLCATVGGIINKSWVIALFLPINIMLLGIAMSEKVILNDLKKPNLNWLSIKQILKNRSANLMPMLVGMGEMMVFIILTLVLPMVVASVVVQVLLPWGLMSIINLALAIVFNRQMVAQGERAFLNIEANNG